MNAQRKLETDKERREARILLQPLPAMDWNNLEDEFGDDLTELVERQQFRSQEDQYN